MPGPDRRFAPRFVLGFVSPAVVADVEEDEDAAGAAADAPPFLNMPKNVRQPHPNSKSFGTGANCFTEATSAYLELSNCEASSTQLPSPGLYILIV